MERLISQRNTFPTTIRQRPLVSFAIANNLLAPSIKAIDLRISPQVIALVACNSFEKFEDMSFGLSALQTKDATNIYIYIYIFHKLVEKDVAPRGLICFTSSNQS
jgi:hypothetical protein